jgi:hypothetical protein
MDAGEDAEALIHVTTLWAKKAKPGEVVGIRQVIAVDQLVGTQIPILSEKIFQWGEEGCEARPMYGRGVGG